MYIQFWLGFILLDLGDFDKGYIFLLLSAQQCPDDAVVSYTVPIAVGAALAGLVLIILIAYVIGRTRNKKGYESV